MLEELGVPYQTSPSTSTTSDHPSKELLALNRMGKQPVLKHGDMVISEVSAICCYSADRVPGAGLAPPSTPRAARPYLKWHFLHPAASNPP
jgi:glutathione S-transferase